MSEDIRRCYQVTKSYALDIINMFSYDNIHRTTFCGILAFWNKIMKKQKLQFWFNILKMWNLLNFVIKTKIPRIPFYFLRTNLKLGRFLSDFQNFYFPWHGKLFFSMTWAYFFNDLEIIFLRLTMCWNLWIVMENFGVFFHHMVTKFFFPGHGFSITFFSMTWFPPRKNFTWTKIFHPDLKLHRNPKFSAKPKIFYPNLKIFTWT